MVYTRNRNKNRNRSKQRNTRRKKGGDYIFQGSYGCTFRPSLPCKGENGVRRPDTISKLMRYDNAISEYKQKTFLEPLDPNQDYFLYPSDMCLVDKQAITPENRTYDCTVKHIINERTKNLRLLFFKDGGENLMSINVKQHDYTAFFKSLLTIFKGLTLLHESNLVHLDIKPYNLVSKLNTDGTFSTRIIDFGMLSETKLFDIHPQDDEFFKEHDLFKGVFDQVYPYWPLELYLVTDTAFKNNAYIATIKKISEFKQMLAKSVLDDRQLNSINTKDEIQVVYPKRVYLEHLITDPYSIQKLLNTIRIQLNNPNDILYKPSTVVKSVDVYALGITLGQIYSILSDHIYNLDGDILTIDLIGDKEYDDEIILERVSIPIFQLVSDMTHPVYEKRITIQEATRRYMDIMPYFAYFTSTRINTMENRTGSSILLHQKGSRSLPVVPYAKSNSSASNNQGSLPTIEEEGVSLGSLSLSNSEYNLTSPHPFGIEEPNHFFVSRSNNSFKPMTVRKTSGRKNITRKRK